MYPDSEILFPPRCIRQLRDLRGPKWAELIDHLMSLPDGHKDVLALSHLLIDMASCLTCDLDSYRASLGCCTCAARTVSGYKGTDEELIQEYEEARQEVEEYLESEEVPEAIKNLVET